MNDGLKKRCAIYTRKSVEEGLEMEFNSLDAQREAGEAYIASQKANGWKCLSTRYDDGGYSGGNTKRPALKQLMADCQAGFIDIVVVYKIDRLSRSLCDFSELIKFFDKWNVSFCSVTQDINTSTSSGRMMLNILATFAQYEREVIAERIRDKFAASKKKGIWMGGCVPLGYRVDNRKLVVVPEDAELVREIYDRYLKTQSVKQVACDLNAAGYTTRAGKEWDGNKLYHLLHNCTYIGRLPYKGESYEGQHEGIVDKETWEMVQRYLTNDPRQGIYAHRNETVVPLKGLVYCGHCGCPMTQAVTHNHGRYYSYFRCSKDAKRATSICPVRAVAGDQVERVVFSRLTSVLHTPVMLARIEGVADIEAARLEEFISPDFWREATNPEKRKICELLVHRVTLFVDKVELEIKAEGIRAIKEQIDHES